MWGTFLMLAVAAVVWYVLNRTAYGRHIYATGDDPEAARLAGINTDRILLSVYVFAGLIAAIAGWALIGRVGAISPTAGENANLDSITAVVIGGTVAVRRQRVDHRHAGRRADRRRLPLRRFPRRARRALAGVRHRRPDHRRGRSRPVDPEGVEMSVEPALHGSQPRQALRARHRARPRRLRPFSRRDPRGHRGQRRRQVDADQGSLRRGHSRLGEIRLGGEVVTSLSPIAAREAGIETVYQTLALSPALSIADNMFLGREPRAPGIMGQWFRATDRARMAKFAREKLNELGLMTIQNIHQPVETLSGGQRQGVAVARAAAFAKRVVIMDEPTAALGVKESRRVLELILDVKKRGLPIILISHNMPHVFEVADRIHIHRLGRRLTVVDPKKVTMSDAVAMMTGAMAPPVEAEAA